MRTLRLTSIAAAAAMIFATPAFAAQYSVQEVDTYRTSLSATPTSINNAGTVTVLTDLRYNPPIDLSLIDFDSEFWIDSLTDIDAARNGNFNTEDLQAIVNFIISQAGTNQTQQIATNQSYLWENSTLIFEPGFDTVDDDFNGYSQSTDTRANAINDSGVVAGTSEGKYYKVPYTNEEGNEVTYLVQDHGSRAFVNINGNVVGIVSDSDIAGGYSEARDITNGLLVAGVEVIDPFETLEELVNVTCNDDEARGDIPVELCIQRQINAGLQNSHKIRAALWQLDQQGNVLERTSFGLPITPDEDDNRAFISEANAVNENGIAVGRASNFFEDNDSFLTAYAAIFNGDEVTNITDRNEYLSSVANDINNQNIVVGEGVREINGSNRSKFFVYDLDNDSIQFPEDFFLGSSSVARAINDAGLVVGEGEVEADIRPNRRRHGFLYDINNNTFQDLNDLVACDSPYTIVQAHDINDSGQIAATALIVRNQLDIQGQELLDDDGNNIEQEDIVAVLLNPIPGGEIEDCAPDVDANQERSGGSTGLLLILAGLLAGVGRKLRI